MSIEKYDKNLLICIEDFSGNNMQNGFWADWSPETKFVYFGGAWCDICPMLSDALPNDIQCHEWVKMQRNKIGD